MTFTQRLPEELKALNRWVVTGADSKAPMIPLTHFRASTADPSTWGTFDDAFNSTVKGIGDYMGFVFNGDGIVGIDIDHCLDDQARPSQMATEILRRFRGTYCEASRSGNGVHILCRGKLPFAGKNNHRLGVEAYQRGRFFILTGNTPDPASPIRDMQDAIDWLLREYFPEETRAASEGRRERVYNPVWEPPKASRVPLRPHYPRIHQGGRNLCLTSLGGLLHGLGFAPDKIYQELLYANREACDPPLTEREVQSITQSVIRYQR